MNNTLRILSFLVRAKCTNYLSENKKAAVLLVNMFILFVFSVNLFLLCQSLVRIYESGDQRIVDFTENAIFYAMLLIPGINLFFPSLKYPVRIFSPSDPVETARKVLIELVYTLISPVYFLLLVGSIVLHIFTGFSAHSLLFSIVVIVLSGLIVFVIQNLLISGWKSWVYTLITLLIFGSIVKLLDLVLLSKTGILLLTITLLITGFVPLSIEPQKYKQYQSGKKRAGSFSGILTTIFFRTVVIRPNLLIAILFKTTFLLLLLSKPLGGNELFANLLTFMLVSPLIYFTYIHNNLWGYLTSTYRSIAISRSIRLLFWSYFLIVSSVAFIDLIVVVLIFAFGKHYAPVDYGLYLSFYIISLLVLSIIGFYASLSDPIEVKKAFNFSNLKSNTSFIFNLAAMSATLLIAFLCLVEQRFFLIPIPVLIAYIVYYEILSGKIVVRIRNVFSIL